MIAGLDKKLHGLDDTTLSLAGKSHRSTDKTTSLLKTYLLRNPKI